MIVISKQQIITMHHALIMETGGLDGLRKYQVENVGNAILKCRLIPF